MRNINLILQITILQQLSRLKNNSICFHNISQRIIA